MGPTWGHRQLSHIHCSAGLVCPGGILVLLQATQVELGPQGRRPWELPPGPPRTLTIRSCMRAFRWSPLALAWAAATWYRSIRCSSASRRVRGGRGTSEQEGVGAG